jgi:acyl-CoA reductase-like NAD-dependent aldehyde dehydrogenase
LDQARKEGRILFGGGRPPELARGYYIAPTAIVDVSNKARVAQEEIFGPVVVIIPFEDRDHALEIANDSAHRLAGYICTESHTTVHYVSHRLQTGMIWINAGFDRDLRQPFGGLKDSGVGREDGRQSREFFTETRFASFPLIRAERRTRVSWSRSQPDPQYQPGEWQQSPDPPRAAMTYIDATAIVG